MTKNFGIHFFITITIIIQYFSFPYIFNVNVMNLGLHVYSVGLNNCTFILFHVYKRLCIYGRYECLTFTKLGSFSVNSSCIQNDKYLHNPCLSLTVIFVSYMYFKLFASLLQLSLNPLQRLSKYFDGLQKWSHLYSLETLLGSS